MTSPALTAAIEKARTFLAAKADLASSDLAAGGAKAPQQGNPKPRKARFQGIPITVDRPKGFVQKGTDPSGAPWERTYKLDYGFIPGTAGGDAEDLDVFIGPNEGATEAHWILQRKEGGDFDEFKVMLGFDSLDAARAAYFEHVPKKFFGGISTVSVAMMKALLGIEPIGITKALDAIAQALVTSADYAAEALVDQLTADARPLSGIERALRLVVDFEKLAKADAPPEQTASADAPAGETGEQRYILGIVLEPETVDSQGDIYSEDEIRKTAWTYLEDFRNVGLQHKGLVNGKVRVVESFIAPCDLAISGTQVKKGTWLLGLRVADDELWTKVKGGELTGLSIGGFAKKTPVAAA